jgi:hypothetical protein
MSVDSCVAFLQTIEASPQLKQELRAMSHPVELVALGRRRGYAFDPADIPVASASLRRDSPDQPDSATAAPASPARSAFFHHEFDINLLPGFVEVRSILSELEIKPESVDLEGFERSFRTEDLAWTGMSPAEDGFQDIYEEIMKSHWEEAPEPEPFRRDFHLVNLDTYTDHPLYDEYFSAKLRMIAALEAIFGGSVQFSGSLWYPPESYRLWHTNETQPGWRMYLIDLDGSDADGGTSFFRYMNPETKELVTLEDEPGMMRLFKIEQQEDKRLWHCIVNPSRRNRWSFGFSVPEDWMERMCAVGAQTAASHA